MLSTVRAQGFTILELVITVLILSILAATAASRFFTGDEITARAQRDTLLQLARQIQLQSMQDVAGLSTRCPTLVIHSSAAAPARQNACAANASFTVNAAEPEQILFGNSQVQASTGALPLLLRFSSLGRPTGVCSAGCTITVSDTQQALQLCISAEGFIRAC